MKRGKLLRRTVSMLFIVLILSFAAITHAEIYSGEGSYVMSEGENLGVAKERAKADAMRNADEKAGTYVKSYSRAKNFELEEDIIETMTANILKLIGNPNFSPLKEVDNLEGVLIHAIVKVQIDDSDILRWLNKSEQEKSTLVSQMEALRNANEEQARQIEKLKRQLAKSTTEEDKERIKNEFVNEDKIFLSNQKVAEGWKIYDTGDYSGAVKIFSEAIEFNSDNALAYYGRAYAYDDLQNYLQVIADCTKAVQFDSPRLVDSYNNRGEAYRKLGNYTKAILDYNKAIELDQNYARAYNNRGIAYISLGNYNQAFADYDKAISINPKYALAYYNRGYAYIKQKNYEQAIKSFDKYIELAPNDPDGWQNRGFCYNQLGEEAKAQADFAKVKELGYNG